MNLTGNNLEFLYYFVFQYSQLILSLTLGPAGPRGPCGPLTPMAPCGGQHKCVKAHNVCLSCNKQNIYKVFLIVFIISVNFGTEPKVCADYCSPSGFHSPFSIDFFIYNLQAIQSIIYNSISYTCTENIKKMHCIIFLWIVENVLSVGFPFFI